MLKKRRLCKALALLLAAVLAAAMLPVSAMAAEEPAFAVGYPKQGVPGAPGSRTINVLVKGVLPDGETSMAFGYVLLADGDPAPNAQQIKSAFGKIPGVTCITTAQQLITDAETPISITAAGLQDDTDYEFYGVFWSDDKFSEVRHLEVKTPVGFGEPGPLVLAPPTGLHWDTSDGLKAKWNPVANATSYTVTLWKEGNPFMEVAFNVNTGTEVNVQSNISGRTGNYYFTVKAVADGYSPSLEPASPIYSYISPLYGTVSIDNMNPKVGDTLIGTYTGGNNTGTLCYTWKADGTPVGDNASSYTVTADDVGKKITLTITSTVETGERVSAETEPVAPAGPQVFEVSTPVELTSALGSARDGDTIRLTADINYINPIVIDGKSLTLDVGPFTLNLNVSSPSSAVNALELRNSGDLALAGTGQFNINLTSVNNSSGVYANAGSTVTVSNVSVKVASGSAFGVYANGTGSYITVLGDVEVSGTDGGCGAKTWGTGKIRIDGFITASIYINLNNVYKAKDSGVEDEGYYKYFSEANGPGIVWVKIKPAVCEITGGAQYDNLPEALTAAVNDDTIKLLADIAYVKSIYSGGAIKIESKRITIDLNGHDLNIINPSGNALALSDADFTVTGTGDLILNGNFAALYAMYSTFNSGINVRVSLESSLTVGIDSYQSTVTVQTGSITGAGGGIITTGNTNNITFNGPITVYGQPTSECHGINIGGSSSENTVRVNGDITIASGLGTGIYVLNGGTVTVGSPESPATVTSTNAAGIWTRQGYHTAAITVYGDVRSKARAIYATGDADIKVIGDVKSYSTTPSEYAVEGFANSGDEISIAITGNVEGPSGVKHHGNYGTITVTGNVTANGTASDTTGVSASYGSIQVTGNVSSGGIGAQAGENGEITIDGVLTGNPYVKVYYVDKTAAEKEAETTKAGYRTYKNASAVVWVKDESAATYQLTVQNGTGSGSYLPRTQVNITAVPPAPGMVFDRWTSSGGGSFASAGSSSTVFTMPDSNVTITAHFRYEVGGGSGGAVDAAVTPATVHFDLNPAAGAHKDISVTLDRGSYALTEIRLEGRALTKGTDYTVIGSTVTFHQAYLATLALGEHRLSFIMTGGRNPILTMTVEDTTIPGGSLQLPFEDVAEDDWFKDSVAWAYENGLMNGVSKEPALFDPHGSITRAMIVTILHRLENAPDAQGASPFADVSVEAWYGKAVIWAAENHIVAGYGNGLFGPGDPISREQLAVILMNYARFKGYDVTARADLSGYADAEAISPWAAEAVSWAVAEGLIQGHNALLTPSGIAERSQAATILQLFIERVSK